MADFPQLNNNNRNNNHSMADSVWQCNDPVTCLAGDLAALCLSFLDVRTLLAVAQHVSHTWRDAINGGLPAIWHNVCLYRSIPTDAQFAEIAQKSHGAALSVRALVTDKLTTQGLAQIVSFSSLRVLRAVVHTQHAEIFSSLLSSLPLLEHLSIGHFGRKFSVVFPPLQFLKTARCKGFVKGLHNLPSLTQFKLSGSLDDGEWPPGLREVRIYQDFDFQPHLVRRIAALPQLTKLATDWSFAINNQPSFFTPPYDQLSFLPSLITLERLIVKFNCGRLPNNAIIFNYLGAMPSLRKLHLYGGSVTDQDLQCLTHLAQLRILKLTHIETLTSQGLRHVSSLYNLTKLWIRDCSSVGDCSCVCSCAQLRDLYLASYPRDHHRLSASEVNAICQLHVLESLALYIPFGSTEFLKDLCCLRHLHKLAVNAGKEEPCFPETAFASLPTLSCLEELVVAPIKTASFSGLVDCLVQMPKLRRITVPRMLSVQQQARLRASLPRLERIEVDEDWPYWV